MEKENILKELKRMSKINACKRFFLTDNGKIIGKNDFDNLSAFEKLSIIAFAEGEKIVFLPEI